jgi:hypothetical protein
MRNVAIVLGVALAGSGCLSVQGVTCTADSECENGWCDRGICVEKGGADASAGLDASAQPDASTPPDASAPDAGPECLENDDCPKCEKCSGGKCEPQTASEDLKEECETLACTTGNCDGAGGCGLKPKDTECRPVADDCDLAEVCTGTDPECPTDGFKDPSTECRAAQGDCDLAVKCTGTSAACPANQFKAPTEECRAAENVCDKAEYCTGSSADCPSDEKQADGFVCVAEKCEVSTHFPAQTCDGSGVCRDPEPEECAPYVCGATECLDRCETDADCTTGLCDVREHECAGSVASVDCSVDATALQSAIDACAQASTPICYLRASGTCEKILVQDQNVVVQGAAGAAIDPASDGPAISIREDDTEASKPQSTKFLLLKMTVRGATGSGHGIECSGSRRGS